MAKSAHANPAGTSRRTVEPVPLPVWVKPQLAKLVKEAPDGPDWLHEIKFDGYRMHARLDAGRAQILTRRGKNWTDKYPAIANAISGLPVQNAYLDGELCGVLPDGRTGFNLIQNATDTGQGSLVFFLFDMLFFRRSSSPTCAAECPTDRFRRWCACINPPKCEATLEILGGRSPPGS